jgi:hypothetical protein
MQLLGIILVGLGGSIGLVFWLQLLATAFRASAWWGLGSLALPPVGLAYVCLHWSVARKPLLLSLWALPVVTLGVIFLRLGTAA